MTPAISGASGCARCGEVRLPSVERCLGCRSSELVARDVEARGRILAVSQVHNPPRAGDPWLAVLAEVDGGVRVVGLGQPPIAVGDEVLSVGEEEGVPVFAVGAVRHVR